MSPLVYRDDKFISSNEERPQECYSFGPDTSERKLQKAARPREHREPDCGGGGDDDHNDEVREGGA